ncbi:S8 family serine peptidase [Streptomyces chartreusis]|uniref:S8 family serine peptidase n=1 Tax=Streptomyces chartreusis TaxID=1969 RepID=UPI0036CE8AD4
MDYTKLAPTLAAAYERHQHEDRVALHRQAASLGWVSVDEPAKPARAVVSLVCDPQAKLDDVNNDGIKINAGGRSIRTGIVAFDSLETLAKHDGIHRIVSAHRLHPYMDTARGAVSLDKFQKRTKLTGEDVLIGIVDTGIDSNHPAFAGRIERIWDQELHGSGVAEAEFGRELRGTDLSLSRDTGGHGTHVSGICAGAGSAYPGIAPKARIVAVKTNFLDAGVTAGIQYIFRVGREMGLPTVVNLSLGGHFDAHDGTDTLSRTIDEEAGSGKIVCCAAGNEGNDDIHARLDVESGSVKAVPCIPNIKGSAHRDFWLNGWYSGRKNFEVAIASPSGHTTPFQPVRSTEEAPTGSYTLPEGKVEITTPPAGTGNGDHNFFIMVRPEPTDSRTLLLPPTWQLLIRSVTADHGNVDVWIVGNSGSARFNGPYASDSMKIGSPGASSSAITVAAYSSKDSWNDIDNQPRAATWLRLNDVADFSSEGPRRDEIEKPDVTAPGAMIVASLSQDSAPQRWLTLDTQHVAMQGTSMASPFVAGVCALLLQREKDLDPAQVKEILHEHTVPVNGRSGTFDPKCGYGLIDLANV